MFICMYIFMYIYVYIDLYLYICIYLHMISINQRSIVRGHQSPHETHTRTHIYIYVKIQISISLLSILGGHQSSHETHTRTHTYIYINIHIYIQYIHIYAYMCIYALNQSTDDYWVDWFKAYIHVQPIANRVAQNPEIISKTFPTNQNSIHEICD